jgi:hypothetical protein
MKNGVASTLWNQEENENGEENRVNTVLLRTRVVW